MKTTGLELKNFWKDDTAWPSGSFVDGVYIKIDGRDGTSDEVETLDDSASVVLVDGYFCDPDGEGENLLTVFRRWRKKQNTEFALVEFPKGKIEELKLIMKSFGGNVK